MGVCYMHWAEASDSSMDILLKKKNKLQLDEEESLSIKNQVIKDYSEAVSLGLGDYITIFLKLDNFTNTVLKFVDILEYIPLINIDDEVKKRYHKGIENILKMVELLKELFRLLRDNPQHVINYINMIHELGNSEEKIVREFFNYIYHDKNLDIRDLLIIRDSIITLEQLVDKISHIIENIRILSFEL